MDGGSSVTGRLVPGQVIVAARLAWCSPLSHFLLDSSLAGDTLTP